MRLLITNTQLVTMNESCEILDNAAIYIEGNRIAAIGDSDELICRYETQADSVIDGTGKAVFPGFINTHVHSYQNLLKNMGTDLCFSDWFLQVASPAGAMMDADAYNAGAMLCAIESIRSGVTTIIDMTPSPDKEKCEALVKGFSDVGIRADIGFGYSSMDSSECDSWLREGVETALKACKGSIIGVALTPFQTWNNSVEMLQATAKVADEYNLKVITHCLETDYDSIECVRVHGQGEIETLLKAGLLRKGSIIVHGVTMSECEMKMLARSGATISYAPICNMYLASGFAPIKEMIEAGVPVVISTEGAGCNNSVDFIETLKTAILVQKARTLNPKALTAYQALEMSTIGAAKAICRESELGSLEEGKLADFFIFDPKGCIKAMPFFDPVSTLAYSAGSGNIQTVVVNGEIVLNEGRLVTTCEASAMDKGQKKAEQIHQLIT